MGLVSLFLRDIERGVAEVGVEEAARAGERISRMEYEYNQQLAYEEDVERLKAAMSAQGWEFLKADIIDKGTERRQLEFRRPKLGQ